MKTIFEFIGLAPDHRAFSKIAQLPRHLDEITIKANKAGEHYIDDKYDGNHCVIVVLDGKKDKKQIAFFSRNGKQFTNQKYMKDLLNVKKMDAGVYFAEVYCPVDVMNMQAFQALHGPNRTKDLTEYQAQVMAENTRLAFFDYITLEAFTGDEAGVAKDVTPLKTRRKKLEKAIKKFSKTARAHHVRYVIASDEEEFREIAKERMKQGQEGVVGKGVDHPYVCGHKNFHFWKIVKKVTFDLECIGWEEGTGKFKGHVGKLLFKYGKDGEHTIKADLGKGYDMDARKAITKALKKESKDSPIGKVYEIYALEKIGNTNLRQAKVGKLREDKEGQADTPETLDKKDSKVSKKDKKKDKKQKKVESVEQTEQKPSKKDKADAKPAKTKKDKKADKAEKSDKKSKKDKKGKKSKK